MIDINSEIKQYKVKNWKVFRRLSDNKIFGKKLSLGYSYYISGQLLDVPLLEKIEGYKEINEPKKEEKINLDREGK